MTVYSMSEVENLTGINAHTLRVWERRYNFLQPERTSTNIRYYSDAQLRKLLNVSILIRNGYRISKIDKMDDLTINSQVTNLMSIHSTSDQDIVNGLVLSMLKMDELAFNNIFEKQKMLKGFLSTIIDLIYPFLNLVGGLWTTSKASPAQEHFITNLIRQKIISEIETLAQPPKLALRIMLFLLDGDDHEIGLLLAYYIAKYLKWKVYYLGKDVPIGNIGGATEICKPHLIMSMFISPRNEKSKSLISDILDNTSVPFLISGNPRNFEESHSNPMVVYLKNPNDLVTYLTNYNND